jgi:hypothetical protein
VIKAPGPGEQRAGASLRWTAPPLPPVSDVPRSWVPSSEATPREGVTLVHHEGNHAGQDTGDDCHGNGHDHEWQHHGNGSIIRTGAIVPPTVLVTEIDTGGLIVQGRPDAPGRGDRW